jgi:hypothetical protein
MRTIFIVMFVVGVCMFQTGSLLRQNDCESRLKKLEAATYSAQQPLERNYLNKVDTNCHLSENDTFPLPDGFRGVVYSKNYYRFFK